MHDIKRNKHGLAINRLTKNYELIIIQVRLQVLCKGGFGKETYYVCSRANGRIHEGSFQKFGL